MLAPEAGGGPAASVAATPPSSPKRKRKPLGALGKEIKPLVANLKKSPNAVKRVSGALIERMLLGEPFGSENSTAKEIDEMVCSVARTLGFHLPDATWGQVLDLGHVTLLSMDFTQSIDRVAAAAAAFLAGQQQRKKWNGKQQAKNQKKLEEGQRLLDEAAQLRKPHD